MLKNLYKAFLIPDVRTKIIVTLAILALYRFLSHIPVPNVNTEALKVFFESSQILNFINLFTGGSLGNLSIVALGVSPYITASIIIQLLTMIVPKLEELSKEGAFGRQKINQYTQALTLPLALLQAYGIYFLFSRQGIAGMSIFPDFSSLDLLTFIMTVVGGSFLLMWIANIITEYGVGQGVSVIIFAGILARVPYSIYTSVVGGTGLNQTQLMQMSVLVIVLLAVVAGVVYINEAFRKIEIQYASQMHGGQAVRSNSSYIPVKINQAGVIPIIFAVSLVMLPGILGGYFIAADNETLNQIGAWLMVHFANSSPLFNLFYFLLVFGFTYFYTNVTFNPEKIAEELRKNGGFMPGIRPGRATEHHLSYIINRLTLAGGVFLGLIAILPSVVQNISGITALSVGGTGLLIVVSVVLETVKQIESQVITREYETFTK